jgi:hypothetical protein
LIPASEPSLELCHNLLSSAANRFPVPTLVGFHGTGDFDAGVAHIAKLRSIDRYLAQLNPEEDTDLVLIVDGYDVLMQLPPEILIERYFETVSSSEAYLAQRLGIRTEDVRARGMRQTVFWGPDKFCFPDDDTAARCWALPESNILPTAEFGKGQFDFLDVRYLNSGTAIGPVSEMRALVAATLAEIEASSPEDVHRRSDQYWIANLFGRQEYYRSLEVTGKEPEGGPEDRRVPTKRYEGMQTEYHIALDYHSALFQGKAGYAQYLNYLRFNRDQFKTRVSRDVFGLGSDFHAYDIEMPSNVPSALSKLYDSIPQAHPGSVASDWVKNVELGVNVITKHIFAVWHCTGTKEHFTSESRKMWWYRFARSLVEATVQAFQDGELITDRLLDGRRWAPKMVYPDHRSLDDSLGGAWTDLEGGHFVEWGELCGRYHEPLFKGEEGPMNIVASGDIDIL